MVGFRTASEMSILKVSDFDEDTGELTFYQPKVKAWRTVVLPQRLVDSKNTKNMKNWIDRWRVKVETNESNDYMFIQPNGRPFTQAFLTKKLREHFIPVWGNYYPYSSRHWYATANLVKSKVNHGVFNLKEVCDDMHHSSVKVTERYTRTANKWYRIAPYDWFNALLKSSKKRTVEEYKTSTTAKKGCTGNFSPEKRYGPGRN